MTNDEIRIAVAQARGWRWKIYNDGNLDAVWSPGPNGKWEGSFVEFLEGLPNYPVDLNAMHEAEKTLDNWPDYLHHLCCVICGDSDEPYNQDATTIFCMVKATAIQRAEAFLRVKGLWKE